MIPRIVLTGGPCGGKSTAVRYLQETLPTKGIIPIVVPELATLLFNSGIRWLDVCDNEARAFRFQANMILQQITNEDMFYSFAHLPPGKKVMLCDRGTIDNMVYARDEWHDDILSQVGSLGFLKRRYDLIIHLDTLAYGAGYDQESNAARYESREEAIARDVRTWEMWKKGPFVPHLRVAHNQSLDEKLKDVQRAVIDLVRES